MTNLNTAISVIKLIVNSLNIPVIKVNAMLNKTEYLMIGCL